MIPSLASRSVRSMFGAALLAAGIAAAVAVPTASAGAAPAAQLHTYKVTITNLTKGQPLSPPVLVTNYGSGEIFKPGRAANWGVQQIAENGNSEPLYTGLKADQAAGYATDVVRATAPLLPPERRLQRCSARA